MKTCITVTTHLYEYIIKNSLREHKVLTELRNLTTTLPGGSMQISKDQGQFMAMLIQLMNAKAVLEIGTFTGYSSLVMAQALPEDGKLITCDIDDTVTTIAKTYWEKACVSHKITLKLGDAMDTLNTLDHHQFDMIFIDADKRNLQVYFDRCLSLTKKNGLILVDNVLWHGNIINPSDMTPATLAIREFNNKLLHDDRVDISLIPIGDGLTLARKKI